jgi:response regulator receiver domain-containing protein
MPNNVGYDVFIRQAFIEPIRSVLIVDDDYPTFSEILERQSHQNDSDADNETPSKKRWRKDPNDIKKVIESFRASGRPLLVDIHDGENVGLGEEKKVAAHLHQSDLLVLDFQLDGANGDGTKAIEIARSVMNNNHFNLVVVHTAAELDTAFPEMLLGLISPNGDQTSGVDLDRARSLIEEAELDEVNLDLTGRIRRAFSIEQYFISRQEGRAALGKTQRGEPPFAAFKSICDELGWGAGAIASIFKWAQCDFERQNKAKMNPIADLSLTWSSENRWIRSKGAFIAFTNKNNDINILDELLETLVAWSPKPSRLFLTKLRAELDEYGVVAEDAALGNNYVLARWYHQLLTGDKLDRRTLIGETVARHTEQLMDFVRPGVVDFASRLVDKDSQGALQGFDLVKWHFKVDLRDARELKTANRDHNVFACSKKPESWHIETGHIFQISDDFWVCLTPPCDLVPGQKTSGHFKDVGDQMPFFAVKLRTLTDGQVAAIKDIQSNRYLFIELEGKIKSFCINDPGQVNSAPHWFPLYAANHGVLEKDMSITISKIEMDKTELVTKKYKGRIVSQLRYEYAINLMQSLGANFTRVGLGFSGE